VLTFEWIFSASGWAALVTLTAMEIVLGIDNVVFISVLIAQLPERDAKPVRAIGLILAFVFRVVLLFTLTTLMKMTAPIVDRPRQGLVVARSHPACRRHLPRLEGDARIASSCRRGAQRRGQEAGAPRHRLGGRPGGAESISSFPSTASSPPSAWRRICRS